MKIRLSARMWSHMSGSGVYAGDPYSADEVLEAGARRLQGKLRETGHRKDGSMVLDLDQTERAVLRDYASTLVSVAGSGLGSFEDPDRDNLADYNAAQALLRQLDAS